LGYKRYPQAIWEEPELEGVVDVTDDDGLPDPVPAPETKKIIEDIEAVLNDQPTAEESEVEEDSEVGEPEAEPGVNTAVDTAIDPAITIVGIIHSNKRSDVDAVHKVSGAGALAASVRAVWSFSRDAEDKSKYHMAFVKGNLGKDKTGLEYTIEETIVDIPGKSVGIPRIVWGTKSEVDADDLLKQERNNKDARDFKLEAARIFLSTLQLPMKAVEIYEKAEAQGISGTTMKRAKAELGIVGRKRLNVWWWCPTGSVEKTFPNSVAETTVADSDIEAVL